MHDRDLRPALMWHGEYEIISDQPWGCIRRKHRSDTFAFITDRQDVQASSSGSGVRDGLRRIAVAEPKGQVKGKMQREAACEAI